MKTEKMPMQPPEGMPMQPKTMPMKPPKGMPMKGYGAKKKGK